jgi:hypothetical protein
LLILATYGGDPHAGFRIARALQHEYENGFDALVPRICKSAGTLIVIGATRLFMDNMSELGPLDVQLKKNDELSGRNSGLDILQAVQYLQNQSMAAFKTYLVELTRDGGLSTRIAAELASGVTSGLFQPIAAQIDPVRLAETQRAIEIAYFYGTRLGEKSGNLRGNGLAQLITGYPSHSFVIDRKEARSAFFKVLQPTGSLADLSAAARTSMEASLDNASPAVEFFTWNSPHLENHHVDASDAQSCTAGAGGGDTTVSGDSEGDEPRFPQPSATSGEASGGASNADISSGGRVDGSA